MRYLAIVLSAAAGVQAARQCSTTTGYTHRVLDARYDGPDVDKPGSDLATISVSLSSSTTPLYECVAQWPESWKGFHNVTEKLIWSDCIWTGAGTGADKSMAFAVDWNKKVVYLAHVFACSDRQGTEGLATGTLPLSDLDCDYTEDGSAYCTPKATSSGARPDLRISTILEPAAPDANTASCSDISEQYQSWTLEKWHRQFVLTPGTFEPKAGTDTGPSFTLKSLGVHGATFTCATTSASVGPFQGECKSDVAKAAATFTFDPKLNILTVKQKWDCGNSAALETVGVGYMQGTCDRGFNSDVFTCSSEPVLIGTEAL
ncbi:hypothetical protein QBC41DRAFT_381237 [Cercophora samala]|uniref:AA1-like domain-containing protein n=1 Tax=Cercophora samala TaxID=330535 RepID=A0AA40DEW6_9PEZI|nr:hypothetical protein QBC41DRAFT_381237 [Cercophora samala]